MAGEKTLKARVKHKHKTETEWYKDVYDDQGKLRTDAFVPLDGELVIFDPDPDEGPSYQRVKYGDGSTNVIALPFYTIARITTWEEND